MTIAQLKEQMSYQEYIEWQEYQRCEPFLADRLESQLSRIGYSNMFTGMSKPDIDYDYFLISHFQKNTKKSKSNPKDLENKIKTMFGVKE